MNQVDLSIVIVNYKTPGLTDTCVGSIFKFTKDISFEVIVVDNDSKDESEKLITGKYPEVNWINMDENAGFSRANIKGIKHANSKHILLLNSDTELIDNSITICLNTYKALEKKIKLAFLTCQLKGYDGKIQFNTNDEFPLINKYLKSNPFYVRAKRIRFLYEGPRDKELFHQSDHEFTWMGIAFGMINKDVFIEKQLWFDEDFFMYGEDMELFYRLSKEGYKNYFLSEACLLHLNTGSSPSSAWRNGQILISEWLYFVKIKGKLYYFSAILLLIFNHFLDSILFYKQKLFGKITEHDINSRHWRRFINDAINRYFWIILLKYKRKTSSAKNFLKYVPK